MATKPNQAVIYRRVPLLLKRLRTEAAITQRELAEKIRQTQWWVARIETGSRRVDIAEFVEWCVGCGHTPSDALAELTRTRPFQDPKTGRKL